MNHKPLQVSIEQRANLETLAAFLEREDRTDGVMFSMNDWARRPEGRSAFDHLYSPFSYFVSDSEERCGSIACALGHGVLAGIEPIKESWSNYGIRAFGADDNGAVVQDFTFEFLFSCRWTAQDDTRLGAAKRIRYALANGVPMSRHIHAMQRGDAPLCYS